MLFSSTLRRQRRKQSWPSSALSCGPVQQARARAVAVASGGAPVSPCCGLHAAACICNNIRQTRRPLSSRWQACALTDFASWLPTQREAAPGLAVARLERFLNLGSAPVAPPPAPRMAA